MSHKTLVKIALVMIVVFGGIVVAYPLLFSSQPVVAEPGMTPATPVAK